jgi:hypothetical protein
MLKEPDDRRRKAVIREYFRSATRDVVASYRELDERDGASPRK